MFIPNKTVKKIRAASAAPALHAACHTKRGSYCGENRYHQLNNHFPSFLFHNNNRPLSPLSPSGRVPRYAH